MKLEAKNAMLRISICSTQDQDTWILQGRLAGQVVDELTASWKQKRSDRDDYKCAVDLVDVTFVDERGEDALTEMMREGAHFVVRGVYARSLVKSLRERCKQES